MEPETADDAELLRAHGAGDQHAFARLYDRYDRPCFQFIRKMLGPGQGEAAEDVCQETWIAISRHAALFDPAKGSFRTWLFTIARRKVWDQFRRSKVTVLASGHDEAAMEVPDLDPNPLELVSSREMALRMMAAVEALPLEQRGALVMFVDGGLSLEEIAAASEVSVETAKSRLRYARSKLRAALEQVAHV